MEPQSLNPEQPRPGESVAPTPPPGPPAGGPPPAMPPPVVPPAPVTPSAWGPPPAPSASWPQAPAAYAGQAVAPGMMVVPAKAPVTTLAKIGAAWLVVIGVIIGLFGLLFVVLGLAGGNIFSTLDPSVFEGSGLTPEEGGRLAGAVITFVGAVVLLIGVLQLLAGIGSWRGAGIARVTGIIFAILFGLLALGGATNSGARAATSTGGGPNIIGWIVAIGYIYTAAVLIFAWKEKAPR